MAAGRTQKSAMAASGAPADARVAAMLARHGGALMRVARQWSLCHDDALDAFQRGLEIYVRRLETVEPATEAAWLKVVIRHEAMAIRRARADCAADPEVDLAASVPAADRSVEEQVLSGDRVSRSAEALRALKPDEARALMLKAHGMSYDEIARHCGWTYTKVHGPVWTRVHSRMGLRRLPGWRATVAGAAGASSRPGPTRRS
jgi:RNA polymerase sigma factor (sigma-70 family)